MAWNASYLIDHQGIRDTELAFGLKRERSRASHATDDAAWTAARCNRLLRSIRSRLNVLRDLHKNFSSRQDYDIKGAVLQKGAQATALQSGPKSLLSPHKTKCAIFPSAEPEWLPGSATKPTTQTQYRRRLVKTKVASISTFNPDKSGEIAGFPTPFVKRVRTASDSGPSPNMQSGARVSLPLRRRRPDTHFVKPENSVQDAERGLESALKELLLQTKRSRNDRPSGARSLLRTCLRAVPTYIEFDEQVLAAQGGNSIDASSETYAFLEEFGFLPGRGWSALREVVLSHGIHSICNAISDGLLSVKVVERLLSICKLEDNNDTSPTWEFLRIFEAWNQYCRDRPQSHIIPSILNLGNVILPEASPLFMARATLFERGDYINFARRHDVIRYAMREVAKNGSWTAASFFETYIAAFLLDHHSSVNATNSSAGIEGTDVSDIMVRLCGMAIIDKCRKESSTTAKTCTQIVYRLAAALLLDKFAAQRRDLCKERADLRGLVLVASLLLSGIIGDTSFGALRFNTIAESALIQVLGDSAPLINNRKNIFIQDLATAIVSIDRRMDIGITRQLLDRLASLENIHPTTKSYMLVFRTELALAFTHINQGCDLELIDRTLGSNLVTDLLEPGIGKEAGLRKIRWEEGLSEWITATPARPILPKPSVDEVVEPTPKRLCTKFTREEDGVEMEQASPDVLAISPELRRLPRKIAACSPLMRRKLAGVTNRVAHRRSHDRNPRRHTVLLPLRDSCNRRAMPVMASQHRSRHLARSGVIKAKVMDATSDSENREQGPCKSNSDLESEDELCM